MNMERPKEFINNLNDKFKVNQEMNVPGSNYVESQSINKGSVVPGKSENNFGLFYDIPMDEVETSTNTETKKGVRKSCDPLYVMTRLEVVGINYVCCTFVILFMALFISVLEVTFGFIYRNQCPADYRIPIFLIVTGASGFAFFLHTVCLRYGFRPSKTKQSSRLTISTSPRIIITVAITIVFNILFLMWLIVGSIWWFQVNRTAQHGKHNSRTYCHKILYYFTFIIVIIELVMIFIRCIVAVSREKSPSKTDLDI